MDNINQIIDLYTNRKKSCAEIAEICGCSESKIYTLLSRSNIKMRSRSDANKIFEDRIFIVLYNLGLSSSQIGKILGVNSSTVRKRLKKNNFPLRNKKIAARIEYTDEELQRFFLCPSFKNLIHSFGG